MGQMLPALRSAGVRQYMVSSPPVKAVSTAPAERSRTKGESRRAPVATSEAESSLVNVVAGILLRKGKAPAGHPVDGRGGFRRQIPLPGPGMQDKRAGREAAR